MPNPPSPAAHFTNSHSMRDNYNTYGVDSYYTQVASTYRNPHAEGVRNVVCGWMDVWWEKEGREASGDPTGFGVLDMAAGSGEVTESLTMWRKRGGKAQQRKRGLVKRDAAQPEQSSSEPIQADPSSSNPSPVLHITATDPYTSPAYTTQTHLPCLPYSFRDISNGALASQTFTHVICSFALHLVTDTSELFSLLWELSTRAKWLLVIAPGKRPEIKEGWGWRRWDLARWDEGDGSEVVAGKCKGRAYRSVNF